MDRARVPAGSTLTKQGRYESQAFIVTSGRASVEIDGAAVSEVGPGQIVGEMALLDGGPRSATVKAITDMDVLVIGPSTFQDFLHSEDVGPAVAEQLSSRLRASDARTQLQS
jgi:CRP-like cAMP-binding protein